MMTAIARSTVRVASANATLTKWGMSATCPEPLPCPAWAIVSACLWAAAAGTPCAVSPDARCERKTATWMLPSAARPRLAA